MYSPLTVAALAAGRPQRPDGRDGRPGSLLGPDEAARPALVRALLEDAMLGADDIPGGWRPQVEPCGSSLLAATPFAAMLIGERCLRFVSPAEDAAFVQHVGILPRSAIAQPREAVPAAPSGAGRPKRARRRGSCTRHRGRPREEWDDTLVFRRGQLVMSIARRVRGAEDRAARLDETTTAALAAFTRWAALADALA